MEAPYMFDQVGAQSQDIIVDLQAKGNGYLLTVKPSSTWINSDERVFPIILDPSLQTSLDPTKIFDNHVSENLPTDKFTTSDRIKTGYGSTSHINRSYIQFELPSLGTSDLITQAYLELSLYTENATNAQVNAHKVTGSWNTNTITWSNKPSYNSTVEDYQIISGPPGATFAWNITDIVKEWYSTGTNYGLMLKNENESSGYTEFVSSDVSGTYSVYRPQVTLFYVNNTGLED